MNKPASFNSLAIGERVLEVPIVQGGMGVGISMGELAGAVMSCGGMGTISAADPGFNEPDYESLPLQANLRALAAEIRKARVLSCGRGLLAVNIMVACSDYDELVKTAVEAGADAVVSGAGMPLGLPGIPGTENALLAPVVSSGRAARLIIQKWERKFGRLPDFIVCEGPLAGGHLGFTREALDSGDVQSIDEIVTDVIAEVEKVAAPEEIPIVAAGGIMDRSDALRLFDLGAGAVQLGTRFIAARECDASDGFIDAVLAAEEKDILFIKSPTGLPGRAVRTPLIEEAMIHRIPPKKCLCCLKKCDPATTPYCITKALINAQRGDTENGLVFCGARAGEVNRRTSVREIFDELLEDQNSGADKNAGVRTEVKNRGADDDGE